MSLTGKNCVIIGGTGGIGWEIVSKFLLEGIENLAVVDVQDAGRDFSDPRLSFWKADVTNKTDLGQTFEKIVQKFGFLDILINCAAIVRETDIQKTLDVNLKGVINSTLTGFDLMRKDRSGRGGFIVNVASMLGLVPLFCMPIYSATKHAVIGFTRSLVHEKLEDLTGLKLILICPGATKTALLADVRENLLFPELKEETNEFLSQTDTQDPEVVGECIIEALKDGENGSIWRCQDDDIEKLELQHLHNLRA